MAFPGRTPAHEAHRVGLALDGITSEELCDRIGNINGQPGNVLREFRGGRILQIQQPLQLIQKILRWLALQLLP